MGNKKLNFYNRPLSSLVFNDAVSNAHYSVDLFNDNTE
jgi:hypothetical protein